VVGVAGQLEIIDEADSAFLPCMEVGAAGSAPFSIRVLASPPPRCSWARQRNGISPSGPVFPDAVIGRGAGGRAAVLERAEGVRLRSGHCHTAMPAAGIGSQNRVISSSEARNGTGQKATKIVPFQAASAQLAVQAMGERQQGRADGLLTEGRPRARISQITAQRAPFQTPHQPSRRLLAVAPGVAPINAH